MTADEPPKFLSWPVPGDRGEIRGDFDDFYFLLQRYLSGSKEPLGEADDQLAIEQAVLDYVHLPHEAIEFSRPRWFSGHEVMVEVVWASAVHWFVVRREANGWRVHTRYVRGILHAK